ncbi:hypothetical protein K1T35_31345 [Pseudonocardia sp. DSM 110487]|uniref:hypothetical protein n=1 Tax=Pseudonocardia sp. DSM 110487 TaxID=2865833 RepID=UPI001C69B369|nr:hypothetical protein [Pseudonocardia sp. DSM 110487]QYN33015.1 hypothetical protein K1T35_31345 [Pseudonocardia sp. DSM 110487]
MSTATGRANARAWLGFATCVVAVAGVVIATDGTTFPALDPPTVALAPAAAALECAAAGPYEAPERGSVGVPAGLRLCPTAARTITSSGVVLDGWEIRGGVVVDAPEVVVRRSRIVGDGTQPFGIVTTARGSVRIEDVTLTGDFPEAAIGGDRWSGERLEITGVTGDGARLGESSRLRNSTVHDFVTSPGREASALVVRGNGRDVLVEDNEVDVGSGPGRGSAVLLDPERTAGRDDGPIVIRGNVLGGGRYTVREDEPGSPSDVRISGNRFRRDAEEAPVRVSRRAVLEDNSYLDGAGLPDW